MILSCKTFLLVALLVTQSALLSGNEKTALIFGITGQDGAYLAEFLL